MAPGWGSKPNGHHRPSGPPSQSTLPPPICFRCGCEGHYVVDCPGGGPSAPDSQAGSYPPQANPPDYRGAGHAPQEAQWSNSQNGTPAGHYSHPNGAPIMNGYAPSGQPPEYGHPQGPYTLPASAPAYQPYPGTAPPAQNYPPQQGPYQPPPNQQYGPAVPYGQNPHQQSYSAPPPNPQYGNQGYPNQPYGQYPPQNGPPQYGNPGYQNSQPQYGAPSPASQYQPPPNSYPPQAAYGSPQQQPLPPQQSQWNNPPPASYGHSQFQQPTAANRPQYSQNQRRNPTGPPRPKFQPNQPHHLEHGSQVSRSASQSSSGYNKNANGFAGGPQTRPGSVSSNAHKSQTGELATPNSNADKNITGQANGQSKQVEDGEVPEVTPIDKEFNWELEMAFKENPPTENVALAQPLSTTFDLTPVPLLYPGSRPSISRYARKDNLKEFIQPIRSQPQWSYLQEDPAFSDAAQEGELIPLQDVPQWMANRQGIDLQSLSRKRERPGEGHDGYADSAVELEPSTEVPNGVVPATSLNVEDVDHETSNTSTVQEPAAAPGTPTLPRAGTPSLDTEDDVWAPQPGEGALAASVKEDPTEALLASLGVTGSPKPVRKRSASNEEPNFSNGKRPKTNPAHNRNPHSEHQGNPPQQQYGNGFQSNQTVPFAGPHGNPGYNAGPQSNGPYDNHGHNIPPQDLYGNGMSPRSNQPYNNAPPVVPPHPQYPINAQYGNHTYGMPQYNNPPYGYGPSGSPSTMPPQNDGLPRFQDPWAAPQQDNQYGPQAHGMPQYSNGPYSAGPPVPYGNGNTPQGNPSHGNPPHGASGRGNHSHEPFRNSSQGNRPPQRRSSKSSQSNNRSSRRGSGSQARPPRGHTDGAEDSPSPSEQTPVLSECQNRKTSDTIEPGESPLTPTSAEILGKLTQPTRKASSDKKADMRDADDTRRKLRRPQPVVAEAYGRRW